MPGGTTKLGPLARTDLCTWVKGLLDKLMTHLGLGSSMEEPWGLLVLLLVGGVLPSWEVALLVWGVALFSWEALSLAECLTACLPAWVETKLLPPWELFPSWEWPSLEGVLLGGQCWLPGKPHCPQEGGYLPAWEETKLLVAWELLPSWERPFLEGVLLGGAALASWEATVLGKGVPTCLERN